MLERRRMWHAAAAWTLMSALRPWRSFHATSPPLGGLNRCRGKQSPQGTAAQ